MFKTELDWVSACKKLEAELEAELENKNTQIAKLEKKNAYAKTIIQDLLNNSDEYAKQRAIEYLKESE